MCIKIRLINKLTWVIKSYEQRWDKFLNYDYFREQRIRRTFLYWGIHKICVRRITGIFLSKRVNESLILENGYLQEEMKVNAEVR